MDIIVGIVIIVLFVFIMRSFGAWMLRIDEVIDIQKEILKEIKSRNQKVETGNKTEIQKIESVDEKRNSTEV